MPAVKTRRKELSAAAKLRRLRRRTASGQPLRLSLVPSRLLQQVLYDLEWVVARGARINMGWAWVTANGDCEVCLGGAILATGRGAGRCRPKMLRGYRGRRDISLFQQPPRVQRAARALNQLRQGALVNFLDALTGDDICRSWEEVQKTVEARMGRFPGFWGELDQRDLKLLMKKIRELSGILAELGY